MRSPLSLRVEGNVPLRAEEVEEQQTEGFGLLLGHHGRLKRMSARL